MEPTQIPDPPQGSPTPTALVHRVFASTVYGVAAWENAVGIPASFERRVA